MFSRLFAFEWRCQTRQVSFIVMALASLFYGLSVTVDGLGEGMALLHLNAPYRISFFVALTSVLSVPVAMIFSINLQLRDRDSRFHGIIGSVMGRELVWSRLLVLILATLVVISAVSVGMLAALLYPGTDQERVAEIDAWQFVWPWLLFVLPNVLICAAVLFASVARWQRASAGYIAAALLLVPSWLSLGIVGGPLLGAPISVNADVFALLALLDPFGTSAFFQQTQFWSALEKDQQALSWGGALAHNRVGWLLLGLLVLLSQRKAVFALPADRQSVGHGGGARPNLRLMEAEACTTAQADVPSRVSIATISSAAGPAFWKTLGFEIGRLFGAWLLRILLLLWALMVAVGIYMVVVGSSVGEVSGRYPTTALLLRQCSEALSAFAMLMVIYFGADIVWRERLLGFSPLWASTPLTSLAACTAKLITLMTIPMLLILILAVIATGYQVATGHRPLEPGLYATAFYYCGLPLLCQTTLVFFIQVLVAGSRYGNKYAGMVLAALVLLLAANLPSVGITHPLLQINRFPDVQRQYSELAGYGQSAQAFHWYAAYWSALSLALIVVTESAWQRFWRSAPRPPASDAIAPRREDRSRFVQSWLRRLLARTSPPTRLLAVACLILLVVGGQLLARIGSDEGVPAGAAALDKRESYERRYRIYQGLAVPQVVDVQTRVDIYPERQFYRVSGEQLLRNSTRAPIEQLLVSSRKPYRQLVVQDATTVHTDAEWNLYLVKLHRPLQPGATLRLSYQLEHASTPFRVDPGIAIDGSVIRQADFAPVLGYVWSEEIQDPAERRRRGLPAASDPRQQDALHGGDGYLISEKQRFRTTVSTTSGQVAIAAGDLIRSWQSEGRNYAQFAMPSKIIANMVYYFSASYDVRKLTYRGIELEIYHYPRHAANVDRVFATVKATIDYASERLGAYPYPVLRVVEVPGSVGRGLPGTVVLGEDLFVRDQASSAAIDLIARRTAHEVLHQWWGHKLTPVIGKGSGVIVESLAVHQQNAVLARLHGEAMSAAVAHKSRREYFARRAFSQEPSLPLVESLLERGLIYDKAPIALRAVSELIGADAFDRTLRQFMDSHQSGVTATLPELIAAWRAAARPRHRRLIDDWFQRTIDYDLSIKEARVHPLADGRFRVSFEVHAARFSLDDDGSARPVEIDEPIQLALYAKHPNADGGSPLYRQAHRIHAAVSPVELIVEQRPQWAVVDPGVTRLDKIGEDNVVHFQLD